MIRTYALQKESTKPLYEQLYEAIRADILAGTLPGGERLPSKRALAEHLSISKTTVETAYAQLLAEGYLTARERSGYFVERMPLTPGRQAADSPLPTEPEPPRGSAAAQFPLSVWAKLMRGVLLDGSSALLQPVSGNGLLTLRQAIAGELYRQRGMEVSPSQIVVGAGTEYFYNLLIQFLGREKVYGLEELGHRKIARVYGANRLKTVSVAMDQSGVRLDALAESGADVLHLSPSHHYPTGIVTPIARRQGIMAWLGEKQERYVIEDDYDSEFRFSGRPVPTMCSMDQTGRVIYMNTFSKTIAPTLRISYIILPPPLLERWRQTMGFYSCTVPSLEQLTLSRFLAEGYFEKHLNRMRKHYRAVREQLLRLLGEPQYEAFFSVSGAEAGLHLLLQVHTDLSDQSLQALFARAGLELPLLSSFYIGQPLASARGCAVVSYADLPLEQLQAGLQTLEQLLA